MEIEEEVVIDLKLLLEDCERQFRTQQGEQMAKLESPLSLVEVRAANMWAEHFGDLADACAHYKGLLPEPPPPPAPAQPVMMTEGDINAVESERPAESALHAG